VIMNLEELKIQMDQQAEKQSARRAVHFAGIIDGNRSVSVVNKIKKSLLFEIIVSILLTITCAVLSFTIDAISFRLYFAITAIVAAIFSMVLFYQYQKVNKTEQASLPLKQNLQSIISIISAYQKRYFQFSIALMPVTVSLAIGLAYIDNSAQFASLEKPEFIIPFSL
jgi:hypothetical protein